MNFMDKINWQGNHKEAWGINGVSSQPAHVDALASQNLVCVPGTKEHIFFSLPLVQISIYLPLISC